MATLYVTEPGVQVQQQGERLLVRRGSELLQDIPLIKIDRVVIVGRGAGLTTPALYALAQRRVDVLFLNSHGGFVSRLVGREHRHSRLRQQQALAVGDPQRALAAARSITAGKIHNQRVLLGRHAEGAAWAAGPLQSMAQSITRLEEAHTLDEVRGLEGLAARQYFSLLRQVLHPPRDGRSWGFEQRQYYPPPDPINALLSLAYTLLLNQVISACQVAGLDPDLGFFHTIDYNKPSMALDLEEEFRPILADSIVLLAANRPLLGLADFEQAAAARPPANPERPAEDGLLLAAQAAVQALTARPSAGQSQSPAGQPPAAGAAVRPVHLKDAARRRFISLFEARLDEAVVHPPSGERTSYRRVIELQAYHMAQFILGQAAAYQPFTVR
jgi:CRISPR-associated protein Cas1